jgi:uroporphyrinogen-III synthase
MKILSTKRLSEAQKATLTEHGMEVREYDAIDILPLDFETPAVVGHAIITSRNAAKCIIHKKIRPENCFCVGEKTRQFLEENGQHVVKMEQNASKLAEYLVKNHKNGAFWFFCGTRRREELPQLLRKHNILLNEVPVYRTSLNTPVLDEVFDGILFFSPSAVESFFVNNFIRQSTAFCIGETTAGAVKPYTGNIVTASIPTVENVLERVIKHLHRP